MWTCPWGNKIAPSELDVAAADGVVCCAVDAAVGAVSRKVVEVPVVDIVVAGEVAASVDIELNEARVEEAPA
jgi:hypothetical protein